MSKLYFHAQSKDRLRHFAQDLPQSLLVTGPSGIGLGGVIDFLQNEPRVIVQTVLPEKDEKVDIEKGVISVDSIRRLYDMTKTIETQKRLIVIDYSERMGIQAQNAFLKLLEEPGVNTHFILISHDPSRFLPTILSRAQQLEMRPITSEQSNELLDELAVTDQQKRSQLLFMAEGLPAELKRLAGDEMYFESRAQIVRDAREFLQGSHYEQLKLAQKYKDSREDTLLLLTDALKLIEKNVVSGKSDLIPSIQRLLTTYERVEANGNIRLQLAAAMV
jgi:DNA polymerase-3 subunit delta'